MSRPKHSDIAALIGLSGGLCAIAMIVFADTSDLRDTWINEFGLVVLAGGGAWLAGLIFGRMFGHEGWQGWVISALGGIFATVLGAAVAGTFVMPLLGTMIAPMVLITQAFEYPMLFISWAILMSGMHVLILKSENWLVDKG